MFAESAVQCIITIKVFDQNLSSISQVFTANIVTYGRTFLTLLICYCIKAQFGALAAFLVMFHDFLDHVDGVVAKVQREDGRAKNDCGRWGGFVDAQCDKVEFVWRGFLWMMGGTFSSSTEGGTGRQVLFRGPCLHGAVSPRRVLEPQ